MLYTAMTLHYHGTPISPRVVLNTLAGRCFCVSYARPDDVKLVHEIGQSIMLDNGAFSLWRGAWRRKPEPTDWSGFYEWADRWLHYPTDWAVIPDVIDGSAEENDALIAAWPFGHRGTPVWHLSEPLDRLLHLTDKWPRTCFGSSGAYRQVGTPPWVGRVSEAFDALAQRHRHLPWIHMLRGMAQAGTSFPFASLDSTDIARNHHRTGANARAMADRWDGLQCPARWTIFATAANRLPGS